MSDRSTYPVEGAWRGAIRALRGAQPGIFLTAQIVPVIFWLLVAGYEGFSRDVLVQAALPLPFLFTMGVLSTLIQRFGLRKRRADLRLTKWTVLINTALGGLYLLTLSGYALRLSLSSAGAERALPSIASGLIAGSYAVTFLFAIIWCPWSVPRSKADDEQAAARDVKWLPWIAGLQASVLGWGVFLSVWAARSNAAGKDLWLVALGTFGALLTVFFGVLFFYRFIFLALHPIPLKVQEEFGLRP